MADYYGNAYITVAAGSAGSGRDGFLNQRADINLLSCELEYSRPLQSNGESDDIASCARGTLHACLSSSSQIGPLTTRGWTFQEAVLSPRVILYSHKQVIWKCRRLESQEDGLMHLASGRTYCSPYNWPKSTESKNLNDNSTSSSAYQGNPQTKAKLFLDWYNLLRQYTTRKIGNPDDRMTAMAGIAQKMAVYLESKYIWGIWEADIIRGLLWRNGSGLGEALNSVPLQRANRRAPSWSWACVDGSIHVENYERTTKKYTDLGNLRAEVLETGAAEPIQWDPIRAMNDNIKSDRSHKLPVKGKLKRVQRSDEDFMQYQIKRRWLGTFWLPRRQKCLSVAALLEPIGQQETDLGQRKIVGIALFDSAADKTSQYDELCCLRLTVNLALLLISAPQSSRGESPSQASGGTAVSAHKKATTFPMGNRFEGSDKPKRKYARIGIALVEDEEWLNKGESEVVAII